MDISRIRERDGGRCARCGATAPLHVHHRIRRSQGGGNSPSNLITLCMNCHLWVHANPYAARRGGWLLKPSDSPARTEVRHINWPGCPVWLDGDAGFTLSRPDLRLLTRSATTAPTIRLIPIIIAAISSTLATFTVSFWRWPPDHPGA